MRRDIHPYFSQNAVQKQQCRNNGTQDIEICTTNKEAIYNKSKVYIIDILQNLSSRTRREDRNSQGHEKTLSSQE
jgi:hypothetical protein